MSPYSEDEQLDADGAAELESDMMGAHSFSLGNLGLLETLYRLALHFALNSRA